MATQLLLHPAPQPHWTESHRGGTLSCVMGKAWCQWPPPRTSPPASSCREATFNPTVHIPTQIGRKVRHSRGWDRHTRVWCRRDTISRVGVTISRTVPHPPGLRAVWKKSGPTIEPPLLARRHREEHTHTPACCDDTWELESTCCLARARGGSWSSLRAWSC